jgi:hypothetical protein
VAGRRGGGIDSGQVMSVSDKPRLADRQPFFVMGCPG